MTVDALVSAKQSPDGQRTDSRHEKWGPSGYKNFSYQARLLDFSTVLLQHTYCTTTYNVQRTR